MIGVLVAGGATAGFLLVNDKKNAHLIYRKALSLRDRLRHGKAVRVKPTTKFPTVPPAERREQNEEERHEERRPARAAAAGAVFITSSSTPATEPRALPGTPTSTELKLFNSGRFTHVNTDFAAEPSVAANNGRILETWNWGAALSSNNGGSFTFVNPAAAFPRAHKGFCCDQVAYYVPKWDLWVWLLQYSQDDSGNILRLAVARGDSAFDAARLNASTFHLIDLRPRDLNPNWPVDTWFDFNNVSSTDSNLFVATNVAADSYHGVVIRIPLDDLADGNSTIDLGKVFFWDTGELQAPMLVKDARDTMYFASHLTADTIRVWSWQDGSTRVGRNDIAHSAYRNKRPYHCVRAGVTSGDWCQGLRRGGFKNDDSLLAGWYSNGLVGFAWNAAQDAAHGFAYPFVMAVEIDPSSMRLVREPALWNPKFAYQYPAITPNARGDLGGVLLRGGGSAFATCSLVVRDASSSRSASGWEIYDVDASDRDLGQPFTGDYLGAAKSSGQANTWVASCLSLHGGTTTDHLAIDYLAFGRASERAP